MEGWTIGEAKQRCEVDDIRPFLEQGRFAGYAQAIHAGNDPILIPQTVWKDIEFVDEAASCLVHRPSQAEFVDLRIYPILHAPDAPGLLHDQALSEVFMATIVKDPEVATVGRHIMERGHSSDIFLKGNAPGQFRNSHWYLHRSADAMAENFVHIFCFMWERLPPRPVSLFRSASIVLTDRLCALSGLLASGRIASKGTYRLNGQFVSINRAHWLVADYTLDAKCGALCEPNHPDPQAIWTGIILQDPVIQSREPFEARFAAIVSYKASGNGTSVSAERRCEAWLRALVLRFKSLRPWSKSALQREALAHWPGLSGKSFERAWSAATEGDTGKNWRKAGAPQKGTPPLIPSPESLRRQSMLLESPPR